MSIELGILTIKQEEVFVEDNNDNYLEKGFDINIKVEHEAEFEDECLQNLLSAEKLEQTIDYNDLKKESLQTCIICLQFFTDSYSLCKHNLKHLVVPLIRRKIFICDHCPSYYCKKIDLENHILSHISKQKPEESRVTKQKHKCTICSRTYKYKTWVMHMKEVHGQLNLKCITCNYTFKCERYLKKHIRHIHQGVKPKSQSEDVECAECSKKFNHKYALKTHIRNCHSESHRCKICKSVLKSKSYLLTHMKRVHYSDGKSHSCDICCKKFKSPRYLKIHKRNTHGFRTKIARALKGKVKIIDQNKECF